MKSEEDILNLMDAPYKEIEQKLGIKIRNGQGIEGVKKALSWVVK